MEPLGICVPELKFLGSTRQEMPLFFFLFLLLVSFSNGYNFSVAAKIAP
jgi:hypothetical protein